MWIGWNDLGCRVGRHDDQIFFTGMTLVIHITHRAADMPVAYMQAAVRGTQVGYHYIRRGRPSTLQ
jgi:hypothetical protein